MTDRRSFLKSGIAVAVAAPLAACGIETAPTPGVPRSRFDDESTAEEVTAGIDLGGKLAVVTGCTSGIGFETMRVLALRGAHVVGTSRSLDRAQAACERADGVTSPMQLELSDFDSVVDCANAIQSMNAPLDMLICNAGYLGGTGKPELLNGVEKHFAINHLGHFVLVNRLLGQLHLADQGRIVVVASRAAYRSAPADGIQFDDLAVTRDYSDRQAYGHSKLANVLFALELGKLLGGTRITANSLHPGVINTEIDRNMGWMTQRAFALFAALGGTKTVEQGAATSCYVATSPQLRSTSGKYFEDCNAVTIGAGHLHNESMARRLWSVSEDLTRDHLVTHTRPDYNDLGNR
jgi:NAD(P)-dependent dehydrogenase (short-subunit alcohol dehydrogenase family)